MTSRWRAGIPLAVGLVAVLCCDFAATPSFGFHLPWDQAHDTFKPDPPDDQVPPPDDDPDPTGDPDPNDPDCVDNPDQPHCLPDFCPQNPDDPRCTDPFPNCSQVPSHPQCQPDFCTQNPDHPSCVDDPPPPEDPDPPGPPEDPVPPEPPDEQDPDPCQGACSFEAASGNLVYRITDFRDSLLGPGVEFTRVYNSQDRRNGPLGRGWTHSYDTRLIPVTDGVEISALSRDSNGKRSRFRRQPDGTYLPPRDFYAELVHEVDGTWTLNEKLGETKLFSAQGLLTSITDRSGNETTFTYDGTGFLTTITTATSETYTLTKGPDGKIASITDPLSRVFSYDYDLDGNLTFVTNAVSETVEYRYGADGRLEQILDPLDRVTQNLSYDAWGRLKSYIEDGEAWTVEYFPSKDKTIKVDSQGGLWKNYYNRNGNVVRRVDPLGGQLDLGYDRSLRWTSLTDERGSRWTWLNNEQGRAIALTDPLDNTTDYSFDSTGELLLSVTYPGPRTVDLQYDASGRLEEVVDAEGRWFFLGYNADGTVDYSLDANDQQTNYLYDARSHLRQIESPEGSTTQLEHDAVGNLESLIDAGGRRFEFGYDDLNRVDSIIDPDLNETELEWAPSCPTCAEESRLSLFRDATGRELRWHYDGFGRLTQTVRAGTETTDFAYDGRGLVDSITDPRGIETTLTHDERGLLETVLHPDAGVTTYGFDPARILVQIDDAEGHTTSRTLDAVGRTESVTAEPTGLTQYTYTPEGFPETRTDARQVTATYSYDGRARLTGLSFADPADNVSFAWDEAASDNGGGRLTSMADASGSTRYHYDPDGRLKQVDTDIGGVANSTVYTYTPGDLLESLTYPSGIRVEYFYDSRGLVESVNLVDGGQTHPVISSALYDEAGRLKSWVHGSGLAEIWTYDPKGRVESITAGAAHQVSYVRGPAGRVTGMTDLLDPSLNRTYGYDDAGRLTAASGPWGTISYGYDLVDNRTSRTEGACATSYQYTDNRLNTLSGCESASYQYDPAGNTLSDGSVEYEYNQLGRLDRVLNSGVEVASYTYNGANQRVKKVTASGAVYYHYDSEGNLLEETDDQGVVLASYIHLPGGHPLALVVDGDLFHYHLDQLATPRRLTDALGAIAWSAELLPFGAVWQEGGNIDQRLRFPGQLHDEESGLHYNWHRIYDPSIGRYLRADPAGAHKGWLVSDEQRVDDEGRQTVKNPILLAARGTNLYAYVTSDPVNWIDPEGLEILILFGRGGGIIRPGMTGRLPPSMQYRAPPRLPRQTQIKLRRVYEPPPRIGPKPDPWWARLIDLIFGNAGQSQYGVPLPLFHPPQSSSACPKQEPEPYDPYKPILM